MPDIATISAFLGSIKTATELAKALKGADTSLEKAELKLKIAGLIESLADAKIQAAEIQDLIRERDQKIIELENIVKSKSEMICGKDNLYYKSDDKTPFCSYCWEVNQLAVHLIPAISPYLPQFDSLMCMNCKNTYRKLKEF